MGRWQCPLSFHSSLEYLMPEPNRYSCVNTNLITERAFKWAIPLVVVLLRLVGAPRGVARQLNTTVGRAFLTNPVCQHARATSALLASSSANQQDLATVESLPPQRKYRSSTFPSIATQTTAWAACYQPSLHADSK